MAEKGYIKLNRKFFEHFLWNETRIYSRAEAWIDLIQLARYEASNEMIKGALIEIRRGEFPASRRFLELRWGWSSTKVSDFLKILGDSGMITVKSVRGQTVINLVNYSVYNDSENGENNTKTPVKRQQNATVNVLNSNVYDSPDDCEGDEKTPVKRQSNAKIKKEKKERN
jgi:hypothetical protein